MKSQLEEKSVSFNLKIFVFCTSQESDNIAIPCDQFLLYYLARIRAAVRERNQRTFPEGTAWEDSFVSLDQSDNHPQTFVEHKLSREMKII